MLKFFIDRPILSTVISVVIVLVGLIALTALPVEQYPDIAPPTIAVYTSYPGANAETVQKTVMVPLEEAINGVENMTYITSTASNSGEVEILVYFKQGTNADMAAVNVQNSVSTALALLPAEVTKIGVTTMKQQNAELKTFALYDPEGRYDRQFLDNYYKINVEPRIKRVGGVGKVMHYGSSYAMRIWLRPDAMAQHGLIPQDVSDALAAQNIEAATGAFGENHDNTYQYTMKYRGRLSTPEEFGAIVLKSTADGDVLRLREVADITLGDQAYNFDCTLNGLPCAMATIYQTAGSNASAVINEIDAALDEMSRDLPQGPEFVTMSDTNRFLYASIREVVKTLALSILLVVLVVYVFLQDLRSTLIPTIAIFVSIIGTFAFMAVAGFSVNLLTLFALVLAIGTVVDNAIIVVEAVQAEQEAQSHTDSPPALPKGRELIPLSVEEEAPVTSDRSLPLGRAGGESVTLSAMNKVSTAIIVATLIFMAVFIPVSMMGGTSGTFYTQFGLTMAVAVGISAINALTMSPAICAVMLKSRPTDSPQTDSPPALPKGREQTPSSVEKNAAIKGNRSLPLGRAGGESVWGALVRYYTRGVLFFLRHPWLTWGTLVACFAAMLWLVRATKTGLVPDEDTGTVIVSMNTQPGTSLVESTRKMRQADSLFRTLPEVENGGGIIGFSFSGSGPSMGMNFLSLKDWDERSGRGQSASELVSRLYALTAEQLPDLGLFATTPPMIPGYGMGNGFELYVQDRAGGDLGTFKRACDDFVIALNSRPEIATAYSAFDISYPQYWVDIDASQCQRAGITPAEVLQTLAGYYGGDYVSNFNRFSKLYRVMIQASPDVRVTPESLHHFYVRVNNPEDKDSSPLGEAGRGPAMAPLSHFVRLTPTLGPEALSRFNLYNAIAVNGQPADGYSSGEALRAVAEVAAEVLPSGYGYEFGGISREEAQTGSNVAVIFVVCLVLVYLILCALYESLILPLTIVLSVPAGLMGSFLFAQLFGLENNIYLQTGLIMLIGLLAKTAILITDYAGQRRRAGATLAQAAVSAARSRLRPILMTALTMVFGMLPLMFATGVGANGNRTLGTGAVGGMLVGTLILLFLTPALWVAFQRLEERLTRKAG